DIEREQHNRFFPSRASDCAGRPPVLAHPELLRPRRPYCLECERQLFDKQRVYDYLASIRLERKVSSTGQIQLRGASRAIGRAYGGQIVLVECDARRHEWVVHHADGSEVKRLAIEGLDVTTLTGI